MAHDTGTQQTLDGEDSANSATRRGTFDILQWWLFSIVPLMATLITFVALLGLNVVYSNDSQYILVLFEATRLLVPLQVAALVAPWNIGHIMKLCAYWVGYHAAVSRSSPSSNLDTLGDCNPETIAATKTPNTTEQQPHSNYRSAVPDSEGTITLQLFFAGPASALAALVHALKPTEKAVRKRSFLRYLPGGTRGELNEFLTLTTTVLSITVLAHVLFAGLVTLLAALTSMQTHEIITPVEIPEHQFGRILPSECLDTDSKSGGTAYSCGVRPVSSGKFVLSSSTESIRTVNNVSDLNQILYDSQNQIALLAPNDLSRALDYSATTLGVKTQCEPKGRECGLKLSSMNDTVVTQSCRPENSTEVRSISMGQAFNGNVLLGNGPNGVTPNPFQYWIWTIVEQTTTKIADDPEVVDMLGDTISILLSCDVTVYNVSYSVQNGTIVSNKVSLTLANEAPSYVVADILALNFPQNQLYESIRLATVTSSDVAELASVMSVSVSGMALAYVSGMFEPLQNESEEARKDVQVARLPAALVWIIVSLGVLLLLEATGFFVLALVLVRMNPSAVVERDALTLEARVVNQ